MDRVDRAMAYLESGIRGKNQRIPVTFEKFLQILIAQPHIVIRNVFQVFRDMVNAYVEKGVDEYPDDPESVSFINYDCNKLFVEGADHPFFADRLFANRLINHVDALTRGTQQNKIYIFEGPPGCGKSTFLNNLLKKFEEYANTEKGLRFETVWRLDRKLLRDTPKSPTNPVVQKMYQILNKAYQEIEGCDEGRDNHPDFPCAQNEAFDEGPAFDTIDDHLEVPCPSHDHPFLMIPKQFRRQFINDLIEDDTFKRKLFTEKEFDWVFRENPCTICHSLYQALLDNVEKPRDVFQMIYARPYHFSRRLGQGITVFNPGDEAERQKFHSNGMLQRRINSLINYIDEVEYLFSPYAKTNNGLYALMDIKSHNIKRLIELHNIISEGVHKVLHIEEHVNSLFIAVMNPEDKKEIKDIQSFSDRITYMNIPYVLDFNIEAEIYRNIFGKHIDDAFLPRVLNNFAKIIISTRLNTESQALAEWLGSPEQYHKYCDKNLQLLKMDLYTGFIPQWISEEHRKNFNAQIRRQIIEEAESEGKKGLSGRDSLKIFNVFYSTYAKKEKLINMPTLFNFFKNVRKDALNLIPEGFLDSILEMYNYTSLQEVKEALYYYNEKIISKDIQNYLFSLNFEIGSVETCKYTGDKLEITEDFLMNIENGLLGAKITENDRQTFRKDTQKKFTSHTLTQEMMTEGMQITQTTLFRLLHEKYMHNLKEKALDPFLENENFRRAIKDYDKDGFKTYDKKIRRDVSSMMSNLSTKYGYTKKGAQEICIYVIDNDLAKKFADY